MPLFRTLINRQEPLSTRQRMHRQAFPNDVSPAPPGYAYDGDLPLRYAESMARACADINANDGFDRETDVPEIE
ncbi:hypothetical protein [Burkholderia lata]|uniref:hypothetical protein n=1 Tax=Burkholderia lata (strain ATCC 17760 / DSM 23089 / LMG 22485 / NCIMB 9086 / R18194 / 383) TaxID=482957 RepID=UPI00242C90FC|nr:hypothetical protein [Burkholderia lata]